MLIHYHFLYNWIVIKIALTIWRCQMLSCPLIFQSYRHSKFLKPVLVFSWDIIIEQKLLAKKIILSMFSYLKYEVHMLMKYSRGLFLRCFVLCKECFIQLLKNLKQFYYVLKVKRNVVFLLIPVPYQRNRQWKSVYENFFNLAWNF